MTLAVKVVSPERVVFDDESSMVVCRTTEGEIAFQTGHAPFIGLLGVGTVRVYPAAGASAGSTVTAAVHGGFVEVRDNQVSVLSDIAELPDQVDAAAARADESDARSRLERDRDDEAAAADLRWAQVRLEVAGTPAGTSA